MNTSPILLGKVFGDLTVLAKLPKKNDRAMWLCRCQCGEERPVSTWELTAGRVRACRKCQQGQRQRKLLDRIHHSPLEWVNVDPEFDQ